MGEKPHVCSGAELGSQQKLASLVQPAPLQAPTSSWPRTATTMHPQHLSRFGAPARPVALYHWSGPLDFASQPWLMERFILPAAAAAGAAVVAMQGARPASASRFAGAPKKRRRRRRRKRPQARVAQTSSTEQQSVDQVTKKEQPAASGAAQPATVQSSTD